MQSAIEATDRRAPEMHMRTILWALGLAMLCLTAGDGQAADVCKSEPSELGSHGVVLGQPLREIRFQLEENNGGASIVRNASLPTKTWRTIGKFGTHPGLEIETVSCSPRGEVVVGIRYSEFQLGTTTVESWRRRESKSLREEVNQQATEQRDRRLITLEVERGRLENISDGSYDARVLVRACLRDRSEQSCGATGWAVHWIRRPLGS